jgi:hypothetical protein
MEETGSLENPIPSGECDLNLNRAQMWFRFATQPACKNLVALPPACRADASSPCADLADEPAYQFLDLAIVQLMFYN